MLSTATATASAQSLPAAIVILPETMTNPAAGWTASLWLQSVLTSSSPTHWQWTSLANAPDLDAPGFLPGWDLPSVPQTTAVTSPLQQEQQPAAAPPPSQPPSFPPGSVLTSVAQAPENRYAWYDHYINYQPTSITTVNATQNVSTYNTITITQTCSGTCTQNANPVGDATSNVTQTIDAASGNTGDVQQINQGNSGSGSTAASPS